jgi:hypothetical protein
MAIIRLRTQGKKIERIDSRDIKIFGGEFPRINLLDGRAIKPAFNDSQAELRECENDLAFFPGDAIYSESDVLTVKSILLWAERMDKAQVFHEHTEKIIAYERAVLFLERGNTGWDYIERDKKYNLNAMRLLGAVIIERGDEFATSDKWIWKITEDRKREILSQDQTFRNLRQKIAKEAVAYAQSVFYPFEGRIRNLGNNVNCTYCFVRLKNGRSVFWHKSDDGPGNGFADKLHREIICQIGNRNGKVKVIRAKFIDER